MRVQEEVKHLVQAAMADKQNVGGIKRVVWVAAGGSNGGFYPAQFFMEHESHDVASQSYTSNEFVLDPPAYIDQNTLVVLCSMRGTPETCKAAQVAKNAGAGTIALYVNESDLTETADYLIKYESIALDESRTERVNSSIGLAIAMNLVNEIEGYTHYGKAMKAFDQVDGLYRQAVKELTPSAKQWAQDNADSSTIYVMASGPAYGSAYIFSICNIEEMLQLNSPTINSCEFFHGPFEVVDQTTSVFQLISTGKSRAADERAVKFLKKYGGDKVYLLDGNDIGLDQLDIEVAEYFNHVLFSPILNNVYMRELSYVVGQDYNDRRYMWKVEY